MNGSRKATRLLHCQNNSWRLDIHTKTILIPVGKQAMRKSSPKFFLSLPAIVLLTAGLSAPAAAGDVEAEKQELLSEMESVARQMAMQQEHAPQSGGQNVEASYLQMKNHGARHLQLDTGASPSQVESFREQARAIGRDHGILD